MPFPGHGLHQPHRIHASSPEIRVNMIFSQSCQGGASWLHVPPAPRPPTSAASLWEPGTPLPAPRTLAQPGLLPTGPVPVTSLPAEAPGSGPPHRAPQLQLPLFPTRSKAQGHWAATQPGQSISDLRNPFRGSVMVAFGPVTVSGAGSLTSVNEVSLERCPGQAWMLDRQIQTGSTPGGAHPSGTPPGQPPAAREAPVGIVSSGDLGNQEPKDENLCH